MAKANSLRARYDGLPREFRVLPYLVASGALVEVIN